MRWTRKSIVAEIKTLHAKGVELNYATVEARNLNLVRAAAWHFGTWRRAVEAADIVYESICKYRRWDQDRIIARIRELHAEGADLSWRSVSTEVDPPLAAAALRPKGFRTWREAIVAAGLDIETVARYQCWSKERVLRDIKELKRAQAPLSSKAVQSSNQPLFCAARRRFGSWDEALVHAGLSAEKIRLRRPTTQAARKAPAVTLPARLRSAASSASQTRKAANRLKTIPAAGTQANAVALPAVAKTAKKPPVTAKSAVSKIAPAKTPLLKARSKLVAPATPTPAKSTVAKTSPAKKQAAKPKVATARAASSAKKSPPASRAKAAPARKVKTTDTVAGVAASSRNGAKPNGAAPHSAVKNGAVKPASRPSPPQTTSANGAAPKRRAAAKPLNK